MTMFGDPSTDGEVVVSLGNGEEMQRFAAGVTRHTPAKGKWHYLHERVTTRPLTASDTLVVSTFRTAESPVYLDNLRLVISTVPVVNQ
jgi:hypothetical protein